MAMLEVKVRRIRHGYGVGGGVTAAPTSQRSSLEPGTGDSRSGRRKGSSVVVIGGRRSLGYWSREVLVLGGGVEEVTRIRTCVLRQAVLSERKQRKPKPHEKKKKHDRKKVARRMAYTNPDIFYDGRDYYDDEDDEGLKPRGREIEGVKGLTTILIGRG
ncbi:hypothetical protein L211DRAFT_851170 [Terfezia boudieri ATCC MYA-4762]|uniref:Uncharacterized protein n=1 Tax=Terfezia boudieri ATCC MYA-4762 TaxID=1051890 RepID=A0A3N4LKG3_9PEZI|nr:hypothetical protein L211DRAFT_851170 [Terfezia boudieri ATCC MYA-4762]